VIGVAEVAPARWGITVPFTGLTLPDHAELVRALPSWGYTDLWSAEVAGIDAFTPLALASTWTDRLRLGTAIASVYTRGPALLAMSAAALAEAAPGRFVLGLGAASPAVVESWNGMAFEHPYQHTRDVLQVVRAALAGERVDYAGPTLRVDGFRLERPPIHAPPILLAALRPQMLRLAGSAADGAILNWLAAADVECCVREIANPAAEVVARIFVCPTEDADHARALGRRLIAAYLTVPAYAAFHQWLGRDLGELHKAWAAGDRRAAVASIDDEVVDALIVHGAPAQCRARVAEYVDHGVTTPVLALLPTPESGPDTLASLLSELGPDGGTADAAA
jgi:probable F420-dependent oxidoreductase